MFGSNAGNNGEIATRRSWTTGLRRDNTGGIEISQVSEWAIANIKTVSYSGGWPAPVKHLGEAEGLTGSRVTCAGEDSVSELIWVSGGELEERNRKEREKSF